MTRFITTSSMLIVLMSSAPTAWAEDVSVDHEEDRRAHWTLSTDVIPWVSRGFSVIGSYEPAWKTRVRFTTEVFGFDYPDAVLQLHDANADEGWRRRVDVGLVAYADWMITRGWHVGAVTSVFRSTLTRDDFQGAQSFWSGEILARAGYRWLPFGDSGLTINPWLAAGPLTSLGETPEIGGERFSEAPIQILGTVHVGWRF